MLPGLLRPGMRVVFVGTSVSTTSVARGHYYSNPTNKFWELLAATGLTNGERLAPEDDVRLPSFGLGLTDIVRGRAASLDALLDHSDYDIAGFLSRIRRAAPIVVAFNGGEAPRQVARDLGVAPPSEGPADWTIGDSRVYRLVSSSATASVGTERKVAAWAAFGNWMRRETPEWQG